MHTTRMIQTRTTRFSRLLRQGAAAALIGLAGASAMAQGHPGRGPGPEGMPAFGHIAHMLEGVGATDAQRSQIKAIFDQAKKDLATTHTAERDLHKQQMTLLTAPTIDPIAIENLRVQMSANHEIVSKRLSQAMIDAANVLTPDQRAKLAARMAKMQADRADRAGRAPK